MNEVKQITTSKEGKDFVRRVYKGSSELEKSLVTAGELVSKKKGALIESEELLSKWEKEANQDIDLWSHNLNPYCVRNAQRILSLISLCRKQREALEKIAKEDPFEDRTNICILDAKMALSLELESKEN